MFKQRITLLLGSLFFAGCANTTLVVGQAREAIASEDVIVYFYERPRCNFETIALIELQYGYFTTERLLADMREAAAGVGASGLVLMQSQQLAFREYAGTAKAIRCLAG